MKGHSLATDATPSALLDADCLPRKPTEARSSNGLKPTVDVFSPILLLLILMVTGSVAEAIGASSGGSDEAVSTQSQTQTETAPTENSQDSSETKTDHDSNRAENHVKDKIPAYRRSLDVCDTEGQGCSSVAFVLLGSYLVLLFAGRFTWVVTPNNQYLKSHAAQIEARLDIDRDLDPKKATDIRAGSIRKYLAAVSAEVEKPFWYWLVAFTGRQMSAWRALHEAERLAINIYSPSAIRDLAKALLDKLRATETVTTTLEDEIRKNLETGADLQELVKEAKSAIYRDEDRRFEALADAQNKALWLVLVAAMILAGLSAIFSQAVVLFLAGAAGGLLARLRKVVSKRSEPFDYGVSWTVLFLSPLVGALTGWAGALLFLLLESWAVLSDKFFVISLTDPTWSTLIVALVFGYSATLFEKFVEQLEESLSKKQ
jgi:hypothetical protein